MTRLLVLHWILRTKSNLIKRNLFIFSKKDQKLYIPYDFEYRGPWSHPPSPFCLPWGKYLSIMRLECWAHFARYPSNQSPVNWMRGEQVCLDQRWSPALTSCSELPDAKTTAVSKTQTENETLNMITDQLIRWSLKHWIWSAGQLPPDVQLTKCKLLASWRDGW